MDTYSELFQEYIISSIGYLTVLVQTTPALLSVDDRRQALHALSYALRLPQTWRAARALLLGMASKMERAGYRTEWLPYLQQGVQQSQHQNDTATAAELAIHVGYTYFLQGDYAEADAWFTKSWHCFQQLNDLVGQGTALNRMAMVAQRQRAFAQAEHLVAQALSLLADYPERANSYTVLGEVALETRAWSQAERWFRQALQIWEEHDDRRRCAWGERNLGVALLEQADYAGAIHCYQQAMMLLEQEADRVNLATVQLNLGVIFSRTNRPREALPLYEKAAAIFRETQDQPYLAMIYTNQAIAYRRLQQWQPAEESCRAAIALWTKIGDIKNLLNAKDELGLILQGQGLLEAAVAVFSEALEQLYRMPEPVPRLVELLRSHLADAKRSMLCSDTAVVLNTGVLAGAETPVFKQSKV
ncbi:MAG: tetratricopeptide repeat protein [Caldilineaceae bacterium]|nr:tetratricopeptide repeat protein [Caldilineaceae bacterium]